jgi:DHA1 family multidrug resistance protein-like MFS transporter
MLRIGATSEADALFWVAVATAVQGITRFVTVPFWGILSDRLGRKMIFLRSLYLAAPGTVIAALAGAPWQMSIALAFQGLFSGFQPSSIALLSVSVPDRRLNSSLSLMTGSMHLSGVIGPALGAAVAALLGYREAILIAAVLPILAATPVLIWVPNDRGRRVHDAGQAAPKPLAPFRPSFQLLLIIFYYFVTYSMGHSVRLVLPIALRRLHEGSVDAITGLTFTLGGLASALAVLLLAPRLLPQGNLRISLAFWSAVGGLSYLLLTVAPTVAMFVGSYALVTMLQAMLNPPTNTLIAANAPRERRGTAFGWAGSAQALAFVAGPASAALFGAISIDLGFLVLAGIMFALAVMVLLLLKEPAPEPDSELT